MTEPLAYLVTRTDGVALMLPDALDLSDVVLRVVPKTRRKIAKVLRYRTWIVDPRNVDDVSDALRSQGCIVVRLAPPPTYTPPKAPPTIPPVDPDRELLGVTAQAPWEVVEGAYRAMARKYHPDVNAGRSTGVMASINAAYERLSQKKARS